MSPQEYALLNGAPLRLLCYFPQWLTVDVHSTGHLLQVLLGVDEY